ncbi:hypothetical protein D3C76_1567800 [compost metagenome]
MNWIVESEGDGRGVEEGSLCSLIIEYDDQVVEKLRVRSVRFYSLYGMIVKINVLIFSRQASMF